MTGFWKARTVKFVPPRIIHVRDKRCSIHFRPFRRQALNRSPSPSQACRSYKCCHAISIAPSRHLPPVPHVLFSTIATIHSITSIPPLSACLLSSQSQLSINQQSKLHSYRDKNANALDMAKMSSLFCRSLPTTFRSSIITLYLGP